MMMIPISIMISIMLFFINIILNKKSHHMKFLNSPLECGFNLISKKRSAFSYSFFSFTILFLILELEIILIIPFTTTNFKNYPTMNFFFLIIILILILIFLEWKIKMINWNK